MPRILAAITAALLTLAPTPAPAAVCGDRADVLAKFERDFGEKPAAIGLANDGGVVELLVSPTGSWTLIVTFAISGKACVMAAGEAWEPRDRIPSRPPGSPIIGRAPSDREG